MNTASKRRAVFSDVHGNLAAILAVEAAIRSGKFGTIDGCDCLGDTIGYGPSPTECVTTVRRLCELILGGNHDVAIVRGEWPSFNDAAGNAAKWTRTVLESPGANGTLAFLAGLRSSAVIDECVFVHGSLRDPVREYLFIPNTGDSLTDRERRATLQKNFALLGDRQIAFCGHTHVPGVFVQRGMRPAVPEATEDETGEFDPDDSSCIFAATPSVEQDEIVYFAASDLIDGRYTLQPGTKTIVNVGSVGQPRDGDRRACFVIYDGRTVEFVRVDYDVEQTIDAVRRIPALDKWIGERLRNGS